MSKYTVAVVGATGVVGKELITILEERKFPVKNLVPLASERSVGQFVSFHGDPVDVVLCDEKAFDGVDIAFFSAGSSVSKEFCPIAVKKGVVCIDNTSFYRMDEDVPLVVPEVNKDDLKQHKGIIANPNCSTAQLVLALKPLHDAARIKRVVVSTYQSVSGAGKSAMDELEAHCRANLNGQDMAHKEFTHPMAFNVIPKIDDFTDNGYTKEEMKMVNETRKILGDDTVQLSATAVRVPVFVSHSESVNVQLEKSLRVDEVRQLIDDFPGVQVLDDPSKNEFPTPRDVAGKEDVYIGRIRQDISQENSFDFWCVGDNLKKGAALNAIQIAEALQELSLV